MMSCRSGEVEDMGWERAVLVSLAVACDIQ